MSRFHLFIGESRRAGRHALSRLLALVALALAAGLLPAAEAVAAGASHAVLRVSAVVRPRCEAGPAPQASAPARVAEVRLACANLGAAGAAMRAPSPAEPAMATLPGQPGRPAVIAVYY